MSDGDMQRLFTLHRRVWKEFDYVYPVIRWRSRGRLIGINLNINKHCHYNCIYSFIVVWIG